MNMVKQSLLLLKTFYRNDRGLTRKKSQVGTRSRRMANIIAIIVFAAVFGIIFAFQSFFTAYTAALNMPETLPALLTTVLFIAQAVILVLGFFGTLGTLYFSKDNILLMTLPVPKAAIFTSKFLYCYISELMISAFVVLFTVTAFGVGCIVGGVALSPWFFVIEVVSIFLIPAIPLFIIAILSIPMMYVVSLIKKSKIASLVLNLLMVFLMMAIFIIPSIMSMGMGEGGANAGIYGAMSSFTVFNLPLANSMFLIDAAANFFLYLGATLVGFVAIIGLSALTYPKILSSSLDSGSTGKKKKSKSAVFKSLSFRKTYLKKEIKMLFSTPTIVANLLLPVIILPVMIFLFTSLGIFSDMGDTGVAVTTEFGTAGFILYLSSLIVVSANPLAMMGFSMEGKNILFLKTLPISASEMVRLKLKIADMIDIVIGIVVFVSFSIASKSHDVLLAAIVSAIVCGFGAAFNRYGLYNDLKKPSLNWQNIQELNKNNKRMVKPMLICLGCCLMFLIVGVVFDMLPEMALWLKYFLFALIGLLVDALIYILTAKRLFDHADEFWERIEE